MLQDERGLRSGFAVLQGGRNFVVNTYNLAQDLGQWYAGFAYGTQFDIAYGGRVPAGLPSFNRSMDQTGAFFTQTLPSVLAPVGERAWNMMTNPVGTFISDVENASAALRSFGQRLEDDPRTTMRGVSSTTTEVVLNVVVGAKGVNSVRGLMIANALPRVARPGGLRAAAVEAHAALENPIAIRSSAVAAVEAEVPGLGTTYYASGSGAYLSPAQREILIAAGVPEENIFSGAAFRSANRLENHAEQVIARHLPEGAQVRRWGISWTADQRPIPCVNCTPVVERLGGVVEGQ